MVTGVHRYNQCGHEIKDFHDVECHECKTIKKLGPQGPIQFVPWVGVDMEPLETLLKSGAMVSLGIDEEGDFMCVAAFKCDTVAAEIEITMRAATLDAVLRDMCVMAISRNIIK